MEWTKNIVKRAKMRKIIESYIEKSLIKIEEELKESLKDIYDDIQIEIANWTYRILVHDRTIQFNLNDITHEMTCGNKNVYNMYSKIEDIELTDDIIYEIIISKVKKTLEYL